MISILFDIMFIVWLVSGLADVVLMSIYAGTNREPNHKLMFSLLIIYVSSGFLMLLSFVLLGVVE